MKAGGFGAARNAMMGLCEEYVKAAECDKADFVQDIYDEDLYEEDQSDDEPHYCFMEDEEKAYLERWVADPQNWSKLKTLAKSFESGAKFVPICGDGNCFFSACSTSNTACKQLPNGTATKHNELRQKVCDVIKQNADKPDSNVNKKMMDRKVPLVGKDLDAYIAKKRQTTGQLYTWSDNVCFDAMAVVLDRPVMQLTYPRYIDGVKHPELEPSFYLSQSGPRTKLPLFIHYNGINHYNCFVPKVFNAAPAKAPPKQAGGAFGHGAFGHMFSELNDGPAPMSKGPLKPAPVKQQIKVTAPRVVKPAAAKAVVTKPAASKATVTKK